jgi:hypothetical protein
MSTKIVTNTLRLGQELKNLSIKIAFCLAWSRKTIPLSRKTRNVTAEQYSTSEQKATSRHHIESPNE